MTASSLIRKVSWPLLFIIIGFAAAILYLELFVKPRQVSFSEDPAIPKWQEIGEKQGRAITANYLREQQNIWPHYFRLRTGDDEEVLRGFWIDKNMLNAIDSTVSAGTGNKEIDGYSIFLGKWEENAKRYYSLVVRATGNDGTKSSGKGPWYDMVDPCPSNCKGQ
ncbi:MAG: hypothetical protein EOO38_03635 [Cytophagaceae bacterium]|nr:MAG: hypothetical protein EOO38_03635 [Cytophagaceae bacterium]